MIVGNFIKYAIIFSLTMVPLTSSAQSKPKRDISKDRSTLQKQKAQINVFSRKTVENQKRVVRRKSKVRRDTPVNKAASYLWVDHKFAIMSSFNASGNSKRFDVSTDGSSWEIVYVPSWCKITKYSSSFVLECEPNLTHIERKDWFKVKADNQVVRVDIVQEGIPINISASFSNVYLQHNVQNAAMNCLKINASVNLSGAKGLKCRVVAFFYDDKFRSIRAGKYYPSYTSSPDNAVYAATEIEPITDVLKRYNVSLYLPNDAMAIEKKGKVRCTLQVYCVNTNEFVKGAYYSLNFKVKKKAGRIKTYKTK